MIMIEADFYYYFSCYVTYLNTLEVNEKHYFVLNPNLLQGT